MHGHRGKRRSELATGTSANKASGTDRVSAMQAPFVIRDAPRTNNCYIQQEIMVDGDDGDGDGDGGVFSLSLHQ